LARLVRAHFSSAAALLVVVAPLVAVACSSARYSTEPGAPTLVVPARFAEGQGEPAASAAPPAPPGSAAASASGSAALVAPAHRPSTQPDPTPLRMAEQVQYELELKEGKVSVVSVKPLVLKEPIVTPRRIGRYAIELGIGHELIERVRFDFPGTAADEPPVGSKRPLFSPLTLSERAIARATLLVPHSPRVRRALLVDRGSNTATELEWPLPTIPRAAASASASAAPQP
jgi:hypothetical protein